MYFFTDIQKPIRVCDSEKQLLCEVLLRNEDDDECRRIYILMQEFRVKKTSRMYTFPLKGNQKIICQRHDEIERSLADKQFFIRNATEEDLGVLRSLWAYLDPFDFKYVSPEELEKALIKKEITVVENISAGVCATIWTVQKGHTSMHKHVAVNHNMRGNGIGRFLVLSSLKRSLSKGNVIQSCWLDINNASTLRLHDSVGFVPANKLSVQFLK